MLSRRGVLTSGLGAMVAGRGFAASGLAGKRVVVVGAGMAGIAAGRALLAAGAEVVVVEARDRIGGRLWTSGLWPDLPVDLGASWIHGVRRNPLTALADAAGLKRVATDYESAVAMAGGDEVATAEAWDIIEAAQDGAEDGQSLRDAVMAGAEWAAMDEAGRAALRLWVHRAIEQEYGGDWSMLSALEFDAGEEFGGGDVLFPQGYGALVDALAKGLDIRLGQRVVTVRAEGRGVALDMADGGVLAADRAVITLPLGVLQAGAVRFVPALGEARQAAIAALGMGLLNKCWLRFDRSLPVPDVDWVENLGPTAPLWAEWVNGGRALGAPVLLGFNAATTAREVEAFDDRATVASAMAGLREMFGSGVPEPVAAQVTRWAGDPLALGSYSFLAAGSTPDSRVALAGADWDGRIVFAGEAASVKHASTVHGAWSSGEAAVRDIL